MECHFYFFVLKVQRRVINFYFFLAGPPLTAFFLPYLVLGGVKPPFFLAFSKRERYTFLRSLFLVRLAELSLKRSKSDKLAL